MNAQIPRRFRHVLVLAAMLMAAAAAPMAAANAAKSTPSTRGGKPAEARTGRLDLSLPSPGATIPARSPEDPRFAADVRSRVPDAVLPVADRDGEFYRSQPLFQHVQRLQVLDTVVPLSLKLGKWKTHDERKAMGLSATVPLRDPLQ